MTTDDGVDFITTRFIIVTAAVGATYICAKIYYYFCHCVCFLLRSYNVVGPSSYAAFYI